MLVYKVDNPIQSSLLSFLMLPNTRLSLNPTLRTWSYNIRTRLPSSRLLNTSTLTLILYPFLTEGQYCLLVKKNSWALGLKSTLVRQGKPSHLLVSKPTVVCQMFITFSPISLVLQTYLWFVYAKKQ